MAEDDNGNINGTEDGELVSLLEKTAFTFEKGSNFETLAILIYIDGHK